MKNQFLMTQLKELIKAGANIEIIDSNYTITSLIDLAKEAKKKELNFYLNIQKSDYEDLIQIAKVGGKYVTFVFE